MTFEEMALNRQSTRSFSDKEVKEEILVKICNTLSCGLNDIAEIVSEKD